MRTYTGTKHTYTGTYQTNDGRIHTATTEAISRGLAAMQLAKKFGLVFDTMDYREAEIGRYHVDCEPADGRPAYFTMEA